MVGEVYGRRPIRFGGHVEIKRAALDTIGGPDIELPGESHVTIRREQSELDKGLLGLGHRPLAARKADRSTMQGVRRLVDGEVKTLSIELERAAGNAIGDTTADGATRGIRADIVGMGRRSDDHLDLAAIPGRNVKSHELCPDRTENCSQTALALDRYELVLASHIVSLPSRHGHVWRIFPSTDVVSGSRAILMVINSLLSGSRHAQALPGHPILPPRPELREPRSRAERHGRAGVVLIYLQVIVARAERAAIDQVRTGLSRSCSRRFGRIPITRH